MFRFGSLLIVLLALVVSACGGSSTNSDDMTNNEFIGSWRLACHDSVSGIYTFTSEFYLADYTEYENPDCTGEVVREGKIESPITYGDKVTAESGVSATELDIFFDVEGNTLIALELIYRDGNILYFGVDTENEMRPSDINFDVQLTKHPI